MILTSPNFENHAAIPSEFTCQGKNISPELHIAEVPPEAKSLALIMDDPDAPNGTWTHWVVWNIPVETKIIPANVEATFAIQGNNSWDKTVYSGPCPPTGNHRYFFKLFALTEKLNLPAGSSKADLEKAMEDKKIDETQLMGTYKKA